MIGPGGFLHQLCTLILLAAFPPLTPAVPNPLPTLAPSAFNESLRGNSSLKSISEKPIYVGPPPALFRGIVRYVAIYYDLSGGIRILMPTIISPELLGLVHGGQLQSICLSLLRGFIENPILARIPNWDMIEASASLPGEFEGWTTVANNAVVNLCIDFNIHPFFNTYLPISSLTDAVMENEMVAFIRTYMMPYWAGSPSGGIVQSDPRGVNVEWMRVPSAVAVASAVTYVFHYLTPPGSPSQKTQMTAQHNFTLAGNSTQVATLKLANSTGHLDANLTKRASISCPDFYPNLLPFMQSAPMTTVGTDVISCAA